jgi:hypothetical protein
VVECLLGQVYSPEFKPQSHQNKRGERGDQDKGQVSSSPGGIPGPPSLSVAVTPPPHCWTLSRCSQIGSVSSQRAKGTKMTTKQLNREPVTREGAPWRLPGSRHREAN